MQPTNIFPYTITFQDGYAITVHSATADRACHLASIIHHNSGRRRGTIASIDANHFIGDGEAPL